MLSWLGRHDKVIVGVVGLVVFGLLATIGCLKYAAFGYNSFDLAYFSQTLWWFGEWRGWFQTMHPHLTLGDHAELVLAGLAPIFAFLPDPRTLIVLQAAALMAPVWPLYRLARGRAGEGSLIPLLVGVTYLLYPSVHGAALFEFHALTFALFPLFMALWAYVERRKMGFLVWCLLAMLAREDVALVVMGFGGLAVVEMGLGAEKRESGKAEKWWWVGVPMMVGATYFLLVMKLVSFFAPVGGYKFAVYYSWLKSASLGTLVGHLLTMKNLEMVLAFLMPVLGLVLVAPAGLVLAGAPLAQMLLSAPGGSTVVSGTYYATLFLPGIFYATVLGAVKVRDWFKVWKWGVRGGETALMTWLAVIGLGYCFVMLSPIPKAVMFSRLERPEVADFKKAVSLIDDEDSVVASFRLQPHLARRRELYSLHYAFIGVTQFAEQNYDVPDEVDLVVFDLDELETLRAQFTHIGWARPYYDDSFKRLAKLLVTRRICLVGELVVAGEITNDDCARVEGQFFEPGMAGSIVGELALRGRAEISGKEETVVMNDWLGTMRQEVMR